VFVLLARWFNSDFGRREVCGQTVYAGLWAPGKSVSVVEPIMAKSTDVHGFLGSLLLYALVGTLLAPTGERLIRNVSSPS
jgi:hypothetical protein